MSSDGTVWFQRSSRDLSHIRNELYCVCNWAVTRQQVPVTNEPLIPFERGFQSTQLYLVPPCLNGARWVCPCFLKGVRDVT